LKDRGVSGLEGIAELFEDKSFFMGERGLYVLGDARELLKRLPSGSVDHVVTDPPWGVFGDPYDDFQAFLDCRRELHRVMRADSWLVFFFTPKRVFDLAPLLELFEYRWMMPYLFLGYGTGSRTPLGAEATYSIIMVFAKGRPRVAYPRKDVVVADELPVVRGRVGEPQFKPTSVVSAIISTFTEEGDVILDPFAGYGSIPLVCELFNRRWVAFDVDPLKFEVAKRIMKERRIRSIPRLKRELAEPSFRGEGSRPSGARGAEGRHGSVERR